MNQFPQKVNSSRSITGKDFSSQRIHHMLIHILIYHYQILRCSIVKIL